MLIFPQGFTLVQDILVLILSSLTSIPVLGFFDILKKRGIVTQEFVRKMVHILAASILLVSFLFYSGEWFSPYINALAPAGYVLVLYLIGSGRIKNEQYIRLLSRTGKPDELLRGTFYYMVGLLFVTLFCWSSYPHLPIHSPVSVVYITILAFGDGFADIIGRKMDRWRFTILSEKSVPGSISFFLASLVTSFTALYLFGYNLQINALLVIITIFLATIVEAISPKEMDNILLLGAVLFSMVLLKPFFAESASWSIIYIHTP
ncbi:MAG: diacylglycerol/polyprenol kinase family protein [Candidatus Heimdallarchaeota archaeon]